MRDVQIDDIIEPGYRDDGSKTEDHRQYIATWEKKAPSDAFYLLLPLLPMPDMVMSNSGRMEVQPTMGGGSDAPSGTDPDTLAPS